MKHFKCTVLPFYAALALDENSHDTCTALQKHTKRVRILCAILILPLAHFAHEKKLKIAVCSLVYEKENNNNYTNKQR